MCPSFIIYKLKIISKQIHVVIYVKALASSVAQINIQQVTIQETLLVTVYIKCILSVY